MRKLRIVALLIVSALCLAMIPTSAQAVTPAGPLPMTGLPSVVKKTLPTTGGPTADQYVTFMYLLMSTATTAEFAPAKSAGTATPAQLQALSSSAKPVAYPAGASNLAKGAGAAGVLLGGYQLGSMVGAGAASLVGLDPNGAVCSVVPKNTGGQMLAMLQGQTCDFAAIAPEFVPNTDAKGDLTMKYGNVAFTGYWVGLNGTASIPYGFACFSGVHPDSSTALRHFDGTYNDYDVLQPMAENPYGICGATGSAVDVVYGSGKTLDWVRERMKQVELRCVGKLEDVAYGCTGSSSPFVPGTADPERQLRCTVKASDGATYQGTPGEPYRESGKALNLPTCVDLPPGVIADTTSVSEIGTDGEKVIWDQQTPAPVKDALTAYPECADGSCTLELIKVKDGTQTRCFDSPRECAEWFADPKKAENYQCRYGSHAMSLDECNAYAPTFKIEGKTVYGDPTTGLPAEAPVKADTTKCFTGGWTSIFSPSWIVDGVTCSLNKAFVPDPNFAKLKVMTLQTTWQGSGPGALGGLLGAWDFSPVATGCSGLTVDWGSVFGHGAGKWHLLAACEGDPLRPVMWIGYSFLGLVFLAGGAFGAYRIVGSTIKVARVGGL